MMHLAKLRRRLLHITRMSDEEIYFDEDGGDDGADDGVENAEEDEMQTTQEGPDGKYRAAKEVIGFDDNNAVQLLYDVYNDTEADPNLRGKAICRAGLVLSQHDDTEQLIQAVELILACCHAGMIRPDKCEAVIRDMLGNVMRSEDVVTQFLAVATEKSKENSQLDLFLDLKLRQCEMMLKYADYGKAREYLSEAEHFCPIPPDPNDPAMCRAAVRLLIVRIELADVDNDEEAMFSNFNEAMHISRTNLNPRQLAVFTQIEGYQMLNANDVKGARAKFFEAFRLFNDAGSDKRVKCLPYCALAAMLSLEDVNLFMAPEVREFGGHPVVAPLAQLMQAYEQVDIVAFNDRFDSATKVFNSEFYTNRLHEVRLYVLSKAIRKVSQKFSRVQMSYIAESLHSPISEVRDLVYEMIVNGEMNALVDSQTDLITMKQPRPPSIYMDGAAELLRSVRELVNKVEQETKIRINFT